MFVCIYYLFMKARIEALLIEGHDPTLSFKKW